MFFEAFLVISYLTGFSKPMLYNADVSVYELLYGDLTNMEYFFLLKNDTDSSDDDVPERTEKRRPIGELLAKLERVNQLFPMEGYEAEELNLIAKSVSNLTRRQRVSDSSEDVQYVYDLDDYYNSRPITESKKKSMLVMINLQFLIHTRVKIREAMRLRNVVKRDKRYRLGYLFNRMRKLAAEQRKMVTAGEEQRIYDKLNSLIAMMRLYERVVRLDVDMRDTAALIKRVYAEKALVDKLY